LLGSICMVVWFDRRLLLKVTFFFTKFCAACWRDRNDGTN
jgi:hypothetical protein